MIVYFADRHMNILGVASDLLPGAFHLRDDMKTSELENGISTFEVTFDYKKDTHVTLKKYCAAGNFLLVKEKDGKYTPYTIIDKEDDIADKHIYIYAEDAGLDLLNEIVPAYEAVSAATARDYILAFTADSGFEIGIDDLGTSVTKTLHWDGEETAASRVRSVALEFDNAEIGYSFTIDKFRITHKYINIYKKHGKDVALELRFGREIDDIVERESVANLVTALRCHGGTPESTDAHPEPVPITFEHDGYVPHVYHYDDGDIYTDGFYLKSREYNKKWTRYLTESGTGEGYIVGAFSYDTTSQKELCDQAIAELKRLREPEITYEVSLNTIPENLKLGDTCRIVDDNGELYVSARLIELKVSECNRTREATFGDFKKLTSGINDKVEKLAEEFAKIQAAKTLYTWIVFADDNQGTNLSTDSFGKNYIGIATNKISSTPDLHPDNPLQVYTFSRINAIDGRGFTVRGSWAPNTSYSITGTNIDVVEHEGSTYACNNSHVSGQTFDPSKWVLIAEKGTDGQDGQDGTNGYSIRGSFIRGRKTDSSWQQNCDTVTPYTTVGFGNYDDLADGTRVPLTGNKYDASTWANGDIFTSTGTAKDTGIAYTVVWEKTGAMRSDGSIPAKVVAYSYAEKGDAGVSVTNIESTNSTADGGISVVTVTLSDGSTKTFNVKNGNTGSTAEWYYGTNLVHKEGSVSILTSFTPGVVVGSMYLNPDTSLVYKCTSISNDNASWTYAGDITTGVIDNIEIGGRNLFRGSSDLDASQFVFSDPDRAMVISSGVDNEVSFLRLIPTTYTAIAKCKIDYLLYQDYVNSDVTLSFDAREIESENQSYTSDSFYAYVGVQSPERINSVFDNEHERYKQLKTKTSSSTWKRYSLTWRIPDSLVTGNESVLVDGSYVTFQMYRKGSTVPVEIRNIKFERGSKDTDWTPAPEDVTSEITITKRLAQDNQNNLTIVERTANSAKSGIEQEVLDRQSAINEVTTSINTLDTNTVKTATFNIYKENVNARFNAINATLEQTAGYIRLDDERGQIEVGKITKDNTYVVTIEGNVISFKDEDEVIAFFEQRHLVIDEVHANNQSKIGPFAFIRRSSGNLSFLYVGGEEV